MRKTLRVTQQVTGKSSDNRDQRCDEKKKPHMAPEPMRKTTREELVVRWGAA